MAPWGSPSCSKRPSCYHLRDAPHVTHGLFRGSVTVLGDVQLDLIPQWGAQVLMEDAPILDSL